MSLTCCRCTETPRLNQRLCKECHAANMREWRKTHPLTASQRLKDICRSYSRVLVKRGKLDRSPCRHCGSEKSEMHHSDYRDPRTVEWLCRECHLTFHVENKNSPQRFFRAAAIATALVLAGCTSVRAGDTFVPGGGSGGVASDPIVTIALPASAWNTVLEGLGELALKRSFSLVQTIQSQAQDQMKPKKDGK